MSIARDDTGNIRELHTKVSGLSPNFRDASGGTGGTRAWKKEPTPIRPPAKGLGSNPFSGRLTSGDPRQVEGRDGKAGSSSRLRPSPSRQTTKRRKLGQADVSKYFVGDSPERRASLAIPSTSTSSRPSSATANAIIIDEEDDAPATIDDLDPHAAIVLRTSSPDPMDVIGPNRSYVFDQNGPSPINTFSSTLEEKRKSPQDGESTSRLRNTMKKIEPRTIESVSHPDSDDDGLRRISKTLPGMLARNEVTAQAEASSGRGYVKGQVAIIEGNNKPSSNKPGSPRHIDLKKVGQTKKDGMKPKQAPRRDIPPLPIQHLDRDATRPSGFVSSTKPSAKGKAAASGDFVHLPLKEWSIGVSITSQEPTSESANLVWEKGTLKVRYVNSGSTPFELQVKKESLVSVKYVDIKRAPGAEPLIQILPSVMACVQNPTQFGFKPGSTDPDGLLTFKFDTSASGWGNVVYMEIVQKLVESLASKDGKSILDGPGAGAVWEAVMRVREDTSIMSDLEPMVLDIPKENPPNPPSKPRPRPRPHSKANVTADIFVRRSARLSGAEEERFSPRPDPDEVILGYRSGTGSLNITNGDVSRLKPGEFLNDTLIEFGLKLWLADLQESNPELASQIHVFSSFFYKKLSTKIPEEGYNSVKKWTSKFDLFQKKYVVVPINENLHWYLAIIYLPEHTLLPPPVQAVQVTNVEPRRSTRWLGVVIDSPEAQRPETAPRQSLPLDPDPLSNGGVNFVSSTELVDLESPKTDDQKDEFDVERMVESTLTTPVDPTAKRVDEQQQVGSSTSVPYCPESPLLAYPQSSPPCHPATLSSSDPLGDSTEQLNQVESAGGDTTRPSSIAPSTFYGTSKPQGQRDATPPQIAPIDVSALQEIEIDEDETVGNPDSEPEQAAEHPRTYIYTFDSLASKHPQAVKRLSRYLLMEAHDKKQLAEDALTEPKGMQAIVPHQPNYCDCGIYLLHFAKTFMKDPKASSDIIRNRKSPQKGRRVPHEHWEGASVGSYREELTARIRSMSEEWKKQRGEQDSGTKNQPDSEAPRQERQPCGDAGTPTVSSKAENDDSDSDIEVLGSPQKPAPSKAKRRDSGLGEVKKGPAARVRG